VKPAIGSFTFKKKTQGDVESKNTT
jgi:hypothetical protein